jgi:uncharacterized membrane protein YeaQ/YmgE (transglycosylase-associated protein family)
MGIILFLLIGLVAGFIARFLVPGRDPMGWVGTLLLGITGSLLGGFLARALFNDDSIGLFGAVIGSVIVLLIYNAVTRRERTV